MLLKGEASSLGYFAWRLSQVLDRPVFDRTHLEGSYDFDLSFFREPPASTDVGAPTPAPETPGPNVFEAVRDQLGLRLERDRGPVDVMVVDVKHPDSHRSIAWTFSRVSGSHALPLITRYEASLHRTYNRFQAAYRPPRPA